MQTLVGRWQIVQTPEGKSLWRRMDTGQTQYSSPFLVEAQSEATEDKEETRIAYWGEVTEPGNDVVRPEVLHIFPPKDQPAQARDALTKTVPEARVIPNTTGGDEHVRSTI